MPVSPLIWPAVQTAAMLGSDKTAGGKRDALVEGTKTETSYILWELLVPLH